MDYFLPFVVGFVGSLHCVGMCGAIVLAYSLQSGDPGSAPSAALSSMPMHLAYNTGRVMSYVVIGTFFGGLGGMIGSCRQRASGFPGSPACS